MKDHTNGYCQIRWPHSNMPYENLGRLSKAKMLIGKEYLFILPHLIDIFFSECGNAHFNEMFALLYVFTLARVEKLMSVMNNFQ